jgi:hypothetical protein
MRCPRCQTETPTGALQCPQCKLLTPKGRQALNGKKSPTKPSTKRQLRQKTAVKPLTAILAILSSIVVCGVGGYLGLILLTESKAGNPKPQYEALERLRKMPSSQDGLTVEEFLEQEVKKSRQAGRLVEAEGWSVRLIDESKALISFSYEEKDQKQIRAEWIADLKSKTFAPQTDLAAASYKK